MPPESWFNRKAKFSSTPTSEETTVPDGIASKCAGCGEIIFNKDLERNLKVCPKCGHHHRMTADERIAAMIDEGTFDEFATEIVSRDFLAFPDYASKLDKAWSKVGPGDSFRVGAGKIESRECVVGVSEFFFMGGSMGSVAGEKIARAMELGIEKRLPVVLFTTSGGARMQEGLMALMQMAKTAAAAARLSQAGLPLLIVLTDPTTAGVMASYASLGDILIAEPGALIAFTGQRVAAQAAQGLKLPADYQSAEWRLARGHIDMIVGRKELKSTIGRLLGLLHSPSTARGVTTGGAASAPARNGNGRNGKTTAESRQAQSEPTDAKISHSA